MKRYPQAAILRPGRTLLVCMLVVMAGATAILFAPQLELNPTFRSMIMPEDPDRADDKHAKETFGDDELILVAVENPAGVYNIPTLTLVDTLTRRIEGIKGVREVYSLTRVDNIRGKDGTLYTDDLITELPKTAEDLARIERDAAENPIFEKNIVAPDKQVASINVELEVNATNEDHERITKAIYALVDEVGPSKPPGVKLHVTGYPIGSYVGGIYMLQDMLMFGAGCFLVLLVVMWLVFRSWQGIVGTMLVVMTSIMMAYGSMAVLGVAVTMPLSAVMVFLTALGMQYSTYIGFAYREQMHRERARGQAARDHRYVLSEALRGVRGSVVLSALTTAIGFGSMYVNRVPDLKLMGLFLVIGLLSTSIAAMTVLPAVMARWPFPVPDVQRDHPRIQRGIDRIGKLGITRPRTMLTLAALIFAGGVYGFTQLDTNTDAMQYFKPSSEIRQAEEFVRARMAGTTYLQAVITADKVDAFKEPANLEKLARVQRFAESLPHVTKTVSHADHLKLINRALVGTPEAFAIPATREAVEQALLLHNDPDDFRTWIDADYRNANVMIRMNTMASAVQRDTEDKLEAFMASQFPGWHVNLVGTNLLTHRAFDEMATSMLRSLGIATLLIWLVMTIGLGSIKLGTLSLIPNLAPSVVVYSILPAIGQPLDPPTAVTGAVALGILADDTIHFFRTWAKHRRVHDAAAAVSATLAEVGKPMVLSSVVICIGFSVMLLSRYGTLVWTGVMMTIVTSTALVWELVCTPAMLRLLGPRPKQPAVVDSDLGEFRKVTADDARATFAQYSDAEIARMNTADFLALAGKTVIRHGGANGTRRMLVELDIQPGARVLEIGAGVGATAFDIVAMDPSVHVTGVDLSPFMVGKARARAAAHGLLDQADPEAAPFASPNDRRRPEADGSSLADRRRGDRRKDERKKLGARVAFVHTQEPTKLPFPDATFDVVIAESVAMYNDAERFFSEIFRVLKPGGRLGLHDWCWVERPTPALETATCVLACGCNPGDVKFFTQEDWERSLRGAGFDVGFAEEYPFTFFSWSSMADDEGTVNLLKMFGRVLGRKATAKRMLGMMKFLAGQEGAFGYTVTVAVRPEVAETRVAV